MVSKALLLLCAQTLLLKCTLSQYLGYGYYGSGLASPYGLGYGGYNAFGYGGLGYGGWPGWGGYGWGTGLGFGYGGYGGYGAFGGYGGFGGYGLGCGTGVAPAVGLGDFGGSFGGGLVVTSASPIAPIGLTVTSENAIEGAVSVIGTLPFLGAVATDGAFPSAGAGAVAYGCGDGSVGIAAEAPVGALGVVGGCGCV